MKRSIALILVGALVLAAGIVLAQQMGMPTGAGPRAGMATPGPGAGMMKGDCWAMGSGMAEQLKKQLNLTAEQVTALDTIRKDFMDSTQSIREQLKTKHDQMATLWMADQPDAAAIKDLANQMDTLRTQMRDIAIDHAIQAIAVLTPTQRAQVKAWMQKNPHMMMGMGCGMCCGAGMAEYPGTTAPAGSGPTAPKAY